MANKQKGQRARAAFKSFSKSLTDRGFEGNADSEVDVAEFYTELGQEFTDDARKSYRAMIAAKAFVATEESDTRLIVDWVEGDLPDGEAEADVEDEDETPADGKSATAALAKKFAKLDRDFTAYKANRAPKATVAIPGQVDYDLAKKHGQEQFSSAERAHKFGTWAIANCAMFRQHRPERAAKAAADLDSMGHKAMASSPVADGGALIPDEFSAELIDNQKEYGVIPNHMRSWTMNSGTLSVPKNNGGMTVSYPEEGGAASDTSPSLSEVLLRARMGVAIGIVSRQLFDDSAINIGEFLARETSRAFAFAKDEAGFNGTGLAATGGMSGLAATFAAKASDARTVTGGGTMLLHTKPMITEMVSKLGAEYLPGAAFHCSTAAKANIFHRLQGEVGGLGMAEVAGKFYDTFMGYPIITNEVTNASEDFGGDVVDCYFGNFALAGAYGDRMQLAIDTNPNEYWTTNQIGIRGVARYDVNWHSLGSSTASEGIVALWQD